MAREVDYFMPPEVLQGLAARVGSMGRKERLSQIKTSCRLALEEVRSNTLWKWLFCINLLCTFAQMYNLARKKTVTVSDAVDAIPILQEVGSAEVEMYSSGASQSDKVPDKVPLPLFAVFSVFATLSQLAGIPPEMPDNVNDARTTREFVDAFGDLKRFKRAYRRSERFRVIAVGLTTLNLVQTVAAIDDHVQSKHYLAPLVAMALMVAYDRLR